MAWLDPSLSRHVHHFVPQVDTSIIDYTCNVDELKGVSREKVSATLAEVGFSEEGQAAPITSLSGGWKMKLALARAMLQEAQVWSCVHASLPRSCLPFFCRSCPMFPISCQPPCRMLPLGMYRRKGSGPDPPSCVTPVGSSGQY